MNSATNPDNLDSAPEPSSVAPETTAPAAGGPPAKGRLGRDFRRLQKVKGRGLTMALVDAVIFDSGFQALILHRIAHWAKRRRIPVLPAICRRLSVAFCSIDILPAANLGGGCIIAHGVGLVIGGTAVVGQDCTFLQGVTLGEARFDELACPRLVDRVTVGAGAQLLGEIHVGDDAMIGAGSVVLSDVPGGHRAVGVPARILPPLVNIPESHS